MIRVEIAPHAQGCEAIEGGFAWRFAATAEIRDKVAQLAELERACCADQSFDLVETPGEPSFRFEIRGIDEASAFLDVLGRPPGSLRP